MKLPAPLLGAAVIGAVAWIASGREANDPTALASESFLTLSEHGRGEVAIEEDGRVLLVRPFGPAPVARPRPEPDDSWPHPLYLDGARLWVQENGDVLISEGRGTRALARPTKGRALRLTPEFALWIEEHFDRERGIHASLGRLDRRTGRIARAKIEGATIEGASADARGNVLFLKYLPNRGHREAFLRSADGTVESLPYVGGTPLLLTGGEVVAPAVVGTGSADPFVVRTRLARLAGEPGARRWETLPVRFEP